MGEWITMVMMMTVMVIVAVYPLWIYVKEPVKGTNLLWPRRSTRTKYKQRHNKSTAAKPETSTQPAHEMAIRGTTELSMFIVHYLYVL